MIQLARAMIIWKPNAALSYAPGRRCSRFCPNAHRYRGAPLRGWASVVFGEGAASVPCEYLGRPTEPTVVGHDSQDERKYIGCCGLRTRDRGIPRLLSCRSYWGRGLASEAAKLHRGRIDGLRFPRLLADVEQGHEVSEHILAEVRVRVSGSGRDSHSARVILTYELTRAAWGAVSVPTAQSLVAKFSSGKKIAESVMLSEVVWLRM